MSPGAAGPPCRDRPDPPGRHSIHRRGLFEPGPGGTVRLRPGRQWRAAPIGGGFRHGRRPRAWARVRRVVRRAAGGARDLPAALHVRWPRELPGPRPPAIRVRGSGRAVWDPGRVCRSPRIGVRPLGPFTLRTKGITRPVPHHRVAQEPADVNVIPARHDPRDQSVTGKGIVRKQAQDLVEYECC